ncbi:putative RNA-directed DNA polymerase [Tanacetum coccineum]
MMSFMTRDIINLRKKMLNLEEAKGPESRNHVPPGCNPLGYRWIFKKKKKANGTMDKDKAILVIKGYRQQEGLDYFHTYSLVTQIASIRIILAIAAIKNLEVHQIDVKTAFLNEDLEEEIYMEQPEGFIAPGKVRKLVKSLYGLKQAPKQWHQNFDHIMLECGFKINESTIRRYVIFDMKDTGLADVILGVKITRTQNGLMLSETHFVHKISEKYNPDDSNIAKNPIDTTKHLSKIRGQGVNQAGYSSIIGSLMYLMNTRPDLAYAVSRLSRYTNNPCYKYWESVTRVLGYIRYTREYGLHYTRYTAVIEGYSDVNWIFDIKDSRLTSGYVFALGGGAISWKYSKQTVISRSIMKSEFITLDKCTEEAEWLCQFVEDVPRWPKPVTAICIHYDSQSAIGRAHSIM